MYMYNQKAILVLLLLMMVVVMALPSGAFAAQESARVRYTPEQASQAPPGTALTPVYGTGTRQVDRKEKIRNLPDNDVDRLPQRKTYTDTDGHGPGSTVRGDLKLAEVKYELKGRDPDGIPNNYTAHVVYRGEETYTALLYYEAAGIPSAPAAVSRVSEPASQVSPASPEISAAAVPSDDGGVSEARMETGSDAFAPPIDAADAYSATDEYNAFTLDREAGAVDANSVNDTGLTASPGTLDAIGPPDGADTGLSAADADPVGIDADTDTAVLDDSGGASGADKQFAAAGALHRLTSAFGSLSPIGAATLATLVAAVLTLLILGSYNKRKAREAD